MPQDQQQSPYDIKYGINGAGNPTALNPIWQQTSAHGDCVGFFTEYHKCYIQSDIPERECLSWKEDYNECKLHYKEKLRINRIQDELRKQQQQQK